MSDSPMENDSSYAQIQVQLQMLAAQNELLAQHMHEQQKALEILKEENDAFRNGGTDINSLMISAIKTTVESSLNALNASHSRNGSGRPLEVPFYDGQRGAQWRDFKNKLENELSRPNSSFKGMEYQFMYSKATGDFLKYLNARKLQHLPMKEILQELDIIFRGTNPRLEAIRELEAVVKKGTSLKDTRIYFYSFQSFQLDTGFTTRDLYQKYMEGIISRNRSFVKANFAAFNYKDKLDQLDPTDYNQLSLHQEEVLKYVEEYLLIMADIDYSGDSHNSTFQAVATQSKQGDPMDLTVLDSNEAIGRRLKFLCTKVDGKFPSIHGTSIEKKKDRKLLQNHSIYFGCRRSYEGAFNAESFQRHKNSCTQGCASPYSGIKVLDLASLGISSINETDSDYHAPAVRCPKKSPHGRIDPVVAQTPNDQTGHKATSPTSKPKIIPLDSSLLNKFTFIMNCQEIHTELPVLIDSGAILNVISTTLVNKFKLPRLSGVTTRRVKFGNGQTSPVTHFTTLTVQQNDYVQKIEFWIADIHIPIILGVPWISAICINQIDWKHGIFKFFDGAQNHQLIPEAISKVEDEIICLSSEEFERAVDSGEFSEWGFLSKIEPDDGIPIHAVNVDTPSELSSLLNEYADIFQTPKTLPPSRPEDHVINLVPSCDPPPIRGIGRLSEEKLVVLKDTIDELLKKNFISPSNSPFGASVLFATKPDGTYRMCIDYRGLNAVTIKDKSPLPNLSELRDRVVGSTVFSSMDLRDGFYNILVKESDRHKTAFRTRYGHYEFNVLPMGLTNSPATMQATMNRIFGNYLDIWLLIYLDDLLVYNKSAKEHISCLRIVFDLLRQNKLYLKQEKCSFMAESVKFCGHILSADGVSLNVSKIPGLDRAPPSSPKEVQSFLGLINWFREFIPMCAEVSQPLSDLTRKDIPWKWGNREDNAYRQLLDMLQKAPILQHFDQNKQTYLYTDASDYAIGGWIGQPNKDNVILPVVYYSRKMNSHELKYPVHEKELLAIIAMLDHHAVYLAGGAICKTDHKPLVWLQSQALLSPRQVRWVMKLQEYDLSIEYLPGKLNAVADYLSRQPMVSPKCQSCLKRIPNYNPDIQSLDCFTIDGTRLDVSVVELGGEPKAQNHLIQSFHDRGHQGVEATVSNLKRFYTWPELRSDVVSYIRTCDLCQRFKNRNRKPDGLLQSHIIPDRRFSTIGIDWFFLPKAKSGKDCVMIIVDYISKLVKLIPCKSTDSSPKMALLFKQYWHDAGFGIPNVIVSDRDSKLTSKFWESLCASLRIQRNLATARHQQTNGQVERTIRTVKTMLLAVLEEYELTSNQWPQVISSLEFNINDSVSCSSGYTPFFLVYGDHPQSLGASIESGLPPNWSVNVALARKSIEKAQNNQAKYYNLHRKSSPIAKGDLVLIEREGIQWSADSQVSKKLLSPWIGPFRVLAIEGLNATVELPLSTKIHNVFSVSKLKKYFSRSTSDIAAPHIIDGHEEWEVDKVLDHRHWRNHLQYLVKFKGLHRDTRQWLFAADLKNCKEIIDQYLLTSGGVAVPADMVKAKGKIKKLKLRLNIKE